MHGTFKDINTYDKAFNNFIASLYDSGAIPQIHIVRDVDSDLAYFKRTKCVPVLSEDEQVDCPVFGNWGSYYEFEGWLTYRAMAGTGNEFQLMAADVLASVPWPQAEKWIDIVYGLVTVQEMYADKFGHYPANLNKFLNAYVNNGESFVLYADIY